MGPGGQQPTAEDKKYLFWSCLSFELFGLSLVVDHVAAKYVPLAAKMTSKC